jgi:hypothetical protein
LAISGFAHLFPHSRQNSYIQSRTESLLHCSLFKVTKTHRSSGFFFWRVVLDLAASQGFSPRMNFQAFIIPGLHFSFLSENVGSETSLAWTVQFYGWKRSRRRIFPLPKVPP